MSFASRLEALATHVKAAPNMDAGAKESLIDEIREVKAELKAYEKDVVIYRIAVSALGATVILTIVAVSVLLHNKVTGFDSLVALGAAAIGGLVGLFAPSPVQAK
jgi:hypothetical protein